MNRGSTDEAVVIVKFDAVDLMVTLVRVKHQTSDKDVGGEGWNM